VSFKNKGTFKNFYPECCTQVGNNNNNNSNNNINNMIKEHFRCIVFDLKIKFRELFFTIYLLGLRKVLYCAPKTIAVVILIDRRK